MRAPAATSSTARGRLSTRSQISRAALRFAASQTTSGLTAATRSTKSAAASSSGGTRYSRSPWRRSGSRLVTASTSSSGAVSRSTGDEPRRTQQVLEIVEHEQQLQVANAARKTDRWVSA